MSQNGEDTGGTEAYSLVYALFLQPCGQLLLVAAACATEKQHAMILPMAWTPNCTCFVGLGLSKPSSNASTPPGSMSTREGSMT